MGSLCRFLRQGWHDEAMFKKGNSAMNDENKSATHCERIGTDGKMESVWINWALEEMLFYLPSGSSGIYK